MKILIVSSSAWRRDCSFGNTFSNWFDGMQGIEIANIFLSGQIPEKNNYVKMYYQITDKDILNNMFHFNKNKGVRYTSENTIISDEKKDKSHSGKSGLIKYIKRIRWTTFFIIRRIAWTRGLQDKSGIEQFVQEFNPDLIFQPIYYSSYATDIGFYIHNKYCIPMVGFIGDDIYTLKQYSFSPVYWVNRLFARTRIKKIINGCELLYVASELQKKEYEKYFSVTIKTLMKFADFDGEIDDYNSNSRIRILYTGNLGDGRIIPIKALVEQLKNRNDYILDIYSNTCLTKNEIDQLTINGKSSVHPPVSYSEVIKLQKKADILLFTESNEIKNKYKVRLSFSTKIVDYMAASRCILAMGPTDIASINYLYENDAAIIVDHFDELKHVLDSISGSTTLIDDKRRNAWNLGQKNHNKRIKQKELLEALETVSRLKD